jgi:predicted LPLAT superfamily acyltransferase
MNCVTRQGNYIKFIILIKTNLDAILSVVLLKTKKIFTNELRKLNEENIIRLKVLISTVEVSTNGVFVLSRFNRTPVLLIFILYSSSLIRLLMTA